jgi:hypothetical protein
MDPKVAAVLNRIDKALAEEKLKHTLESERKIESEQFIQDTIAKVHAWNLADKLGQKNIPSVVPSGTLWNTYQKQQEEKISKRKKEEVKYLEKEYEQLTKALPDALLAKEKALIVLAERNASEKIYDCSCGTGRTGFCENSMCCYERIRQEEYLNGPISRADYIERRLPEILAEITNNQS